MIGETGTLCIVEIKVTEIDAIELPALVKRCWMKFKQLKNQETDKASSCLLLLIFAFARLLVLLWFAYKVQSKAAPEFLLNRPMNYGAPPNKDLIYARRIES